MFSTKEEREALPAPAPAEGAGEGEGEASGWVWAALVTDEGLRAAGAFFLRADWSTVNLMASAAALQEVGGG